MALVNRMVSDLTGVEADERDFVTLVVRRHPAVAEPKALDVLPEEIAALLQVDEVVLIEVPAAGGKRQVVLSHTDFRVVVPDEVVTRARPTRGRRPGYRPSART